MRHAVPRENPITIQHQYQCRSEAPLRQVQKVTKAVLAHFVNVVHNGSVGVLAPIKKWRPDGHIAGLQRTGQRI